MNFEPKPDKFETLCGLSLSIIASILAVVQIFSENYNVEQLKAVNEKSRQELRLKPSGFGRHNLACICNVHKL